MQCLKRPLLPRWLALELMDFQRPWIDGLPALCKLWEFFSLQLHSYSWPSLVEFTLCMHGLVFSSWTLSLRASSSPVFYPINSPCPSFTLLEFSLPAWWSGTCLSLKSWGCCKAYLISFPSLREHRLAMLGV